MARGCARRDGKINASAEFRVSRHQRGEFERRKQVNGAAILGAQAALAPSLSPSQIAYIHKKDAVILASLGNCRIKYKKIQTEMSS